MNLHNKFQLQHDNVEKVNKKEKYLWKDRLFRRIINFSEHRRLDVIESKEKENMSKERDKLEKFYVENYCFFTYINKTAKSNMIIVISNKSTKHYFNKHTKISFYYLITCNKPRIEINQLLLLGPKCCPRPKKWKLEKLFLW